MPTLRKLAVLGALLGLAACGGEDEPPPHLRVAGGDPARGRQALASHGCGACHVIPGVAGATSWVGPPLTAYARRGYIAGLLPNRPEALVRWIRAPQAVSPGNAMPDLGVGEAAARDMAAYLYTLGARGLSAPGPLPVRFGSSAAEGPAATARGGGPTTLP
ncbi:c-type cytochrome [Roseomonas sp. OT10]|uniref:c-type cytochrome n=1 Tax=Roseomonas cutis TaxID=2897332 RepID=UPI001E4BB026|nr:c-type cytochrome [Roseomonas sp. OT10]UFN49986.1 c-type cytochrome [Roseomonas sp. OT10]